MCEVTRKLAGIILAATLSTGSLSADPAKAASRSYVHIQGGCNSQNTSEQCANTGLIDLTGVTRFRFSVLASGYDVNDSSNRTLVLQFYSFATNTWTCLGLPCRGLDVMNTPPDAWGWQLHEAQSPRYNLPASQRLSDTRLRVVSLGDKPVDVRSVTVQLDTP